MHVETWDLKSTQLVIHISRSVCVLPVGGGEPRDTDTLQWPRTVSAEYFIVVLL